MENLIYDKINTAYGKRTLYKGRNILKKAYKGTGMIYGETYGDEPTPTPPTPVSPYADQYFTIETSKDVNLTFGKVDSSAFPAPNVIWWAKINDGGWSAYNGTQNFQLHAGDKVKFSAITNAWGQYTYQSSSEQHGIGYWRFMTSSSEGHISIYGNILSMIYGSNFQSYNYTSKPYVFYHFFDGLKGLKYANNLVMPSRMYFNPYVSGIQEGVCEGMFMNCGFLEQAPAMPAAETSWAYKLCFAECYTLNNITFLGNSLTGNNFTNWVRNVAATGTFYKTGSLTSWPTGDSGIPSGWTVQNAS